MHSNDVYTNADYSIDVAMSDTLASGQVKYYSLLFPPEGLTIKLEVTSGYVACYASASVRNPGPGNYDWFLETDGYADTFINPDPQLGRYFFIALVGVNTTNDFVLDSRAGDKSTQGKSVSAIIKY